MGAKNPKETFPAFYAHFTAEIAPLSLSDSSKRSHLKRLITWRLRSRIMNGTVATSFPVLVARLRQLDTELRINNDTREAAPKRGRTSAGTSGGRGGSTTSGSRGPPRAPQSTTGSTGGSRYHLPENQKQMLKKQGRCYKCLEPRHRHYDDNAPAACKNAPWPTKDNLSAKLASLDIEIEDPAELGSEN